MSWIHLKAADGHELSAWCAQPETAPRGAVVVLQEIFGVNAHIRAVCDRLAQNGWRAIAPSLYDRVAPQSETGYDADGVAQGMALKKQSSDALALLDVQAAIDRAAAGDCRVATLGFCWGGTLSWLAATRLTGLRASVAYYGTNVAAHVQEIPTVPVLLHFGEQDAHIPTAQVNEIAAAWPQVAVHRYPCGHGFNCDDRAAFHADSAASAGVRTQSFFETHLAC